MLAELLEADGRARSGYDADTWSAFVEHVAETLDIGPGTRVWDVACGAGSFLYPLSLNGYVVGGTDASAERIDLARRAMPEGRFAVGVASDVVEPPGSWDVVLASRGCASCGDFDQLRALLTRMVATATHALALLDVDETEAPHVDQGRMMRLLAGAGASAVQFETGLAGRWHVYARVGR